MKLAGPVLTMAVATCLVAGACGAGGAAPTTAPSGAAATTAATMAPEPTASPSPSPSPEPTPSPAPTPTPTLAPAATPAPTPTPSAGSSADAFWFNPRDVLDYYELVGFRCRDAVAGPAGTMVQQCLRRDGKKGPTAMVALAWDEASGKTVYAYGGYYAPDGAKKPDGKDAYEHLAVFLGLLLGEVASEPVYEWVYANLGEAASSQFAGLETYAYPLKRSPGSGYFVEIGTPEFYLAVRGS